MINQSKVVTLIIGTYTQETDSQGIYVLEFDLDKKAINSQFVIPAENPSFIHYIPRSNVLLFVEEMRVPQGKIKSVRLDFDKLDYVMVSEQAVQGRSACHIAVDPDAAHVIVSNYWSGSFVTFGVGPEGKLSESLSFYQFVGSSSCPIRQTQSHVHSAFFSPHAEKVFVQDLGVDKIYQFDRKGIYGSNSDYKVLSLAPGSGPRHIAFSYQSILYVLNELTGCINVYRLGSDNTVDNLLQTIFLSSDALGNCESQASQIRISRDGRFVYASNRGSENELVVFKVIKDGQLERIQNILSRGICPRHFDFLEDETYIVVANQGSNNLIFFSRERKTGLLTYVDCSISIPSPACVVSIC